MYDDEKWISEQFGQADLGDPRRARRAQMLALNMLKAPGKGIPEQTQTWGGAKAAYRLFGRPEVTREALMQPHFEQTLQACEARPGLMLLYKTPQSWTSRTCERPRATVPSAITLAAA